MQKRSEKQIAKGAYSWLRTSPILTVFTFFFISSLGFGDGICDNFSCSYNTIFFINSLFAILGSSLWHLLLIQYVNNKESDFVRWHGRQALVLAGVRTAVPISFLLVDYATQSGGCLFAWTIAILVFLWYANTPWGNKQVDGGECWLAQRMGHTVIPPTDEIIQETSPEIKHQDLRSAFDELLLGLQSDDTVTRISSLMKLDSAKELNGDIRARLEKLAMDDDNYDVRRDARLLLNKFIEEKPAVISSQPIHTEVNMVEDENRKPADILKDILGKLQSEDAVNRLSAIAQLQTINYSSEAIRNELEKLALNDGNEDIRRDALAALDLPTQRNVRGRINKLAMSNRFILLNEINEWEKTGLLDKINASVLRKRYDFDSAPPPAPKPVPVKPVTAPPAVPATPVAAQAPVPAAQPAKVSEPVAQKTSQPKPQPVPAGPRPTLLQTLLSETSIKIALYLGAFFVIASAAILAAVSPAARLPILIIATIIFGGLSVAIRKRLPQPSFALFIVFSFLLPITANVVEDSLSLSEPGSAGYWVLISIFMALIWAGGTWLYESRVFSITAFAAFTIALFRIGGLFDAKAEFYVTMLGLAALAGLAGTWVLKKWKDAGFSQPLFFAAQFIQLMVLGASMALLVAQVIESSSTPLWNLASVFTWGFAFGFYVFSDLLFPFLFFPRLAAAALIPIPWFIGFAFDLERPGVTILFVLWGLLLSIASEIGHRQETARKYSLPVLLASIPTFAIAVIGGFYETAVGLATSLGVAITYGVAHLIRPRGWLWALALFNFIIAYFALFALPFIEKLDIFDGYPLLVLSLIFLLPDLFLKADFSADKSWRISPRIYGVLFTAFNFIAFAPAEDVPLINTAVIFGVYALFFEVYALRYNKAAIGYVATTALAISILYTFNHFELDAWLPSLSILSVLYFFGGYALRKNEVRAEWRTMLEASGLILGSLVSLTALFSLKEYGGWFVAVIGLLFIVQMYSRRNGIFEVGAHIFLSIAAYLILRDFNIIESTYTLIGLSLVILSLDLVFSRTYRQPRAVEWTAKGLGALLAIIASMALIGESNLLRISLSFAIYTGFFLIYTVVQRKAVYGYIPAAYLSLAIFYTLEYFNLDAWLPVLTGLAALYYLAGVMLRGRETHSGLAGSWSEMLRLSGLVLGSILSISAFVVEKEHGGYFIAPIAALFIAEMFVRKNGWLEVGVQILAGMSAFMLLREFNASEAAYYFLTVGSTWLVLDMIFVKTFTSPRPLAPFVWGLSGIFATANIVLLLNLGREQPAQAAICFGIYTLLFLINTYVRRNPLFGYIPAAYFPLGIFYLLDFYDLDLWLPVLTGLAVLYFATGLWFNQRKEWGEMLRNSALALGSIVSLGALFIFKDLSGWYMAVTAALFVAEMFVRKESLFEAGAQIFFSTAIFMILRDLHVTEFAYIGLALSLLWLGLDAALYKTYPAPRLLAWPIRGSGGVLALGNAAYLLLKGIDEPRVAMICFGLYSLFFLVYSLLYQRPALGYAVTTSFALALLYSLRTLGWNEWFLPITAVTAIYYGVGQVLKKDGDTNSEWNKVTWSFVLWTSGMGMGLITSFLAPLKGGISAAIPSAVTATMVSVEALRRRNAWLGFPANALYLMSYFILLMELSVDEPQFFSMGAALLGMIQHYLLTRTGSKAGPFVMGMVSQLVLLGTTYIQMVSTVQVAYFFVLFLQSIVVIFYGRVIRSRSLTFTPIVIVVIGVITVLYSVLKSLNTVILIGCTGLILLMLGIAAVVMRERITKLGETLSDWRA